MQLGGRQRLGWPRGVVPTRTRLACATVAERPREAALASAAGWPPTSMQGIQTFLSSGIVMLPREGEELTKKEAMLRPVPEGLSGSALS